jgi:predicted O-linked N-acetylglucosamine transferase (SPINDLY family)
MRKVAPQSPPKNHAEKAEKLYQSGKYSACIAECLLALQKAPKNLRLLDLCALSYLLTGQDDACVASYLEILKIDEGNLISNLNIGKIYINQGKHSQALPFLEKCLIESTHLSNVRLMTGICHEMTGNYSEAVRFYSLVLSNEPTKVPAYIQLASTLFKQQYKNAAIDVLNTGFKINPEAYDLVYTKGSLLIESGLYASAEEVFLELEKICPGKIIYASTHAELLRKMRKTEASLVKYKEALKIDPEHIPTLINYGNLLSHLKRIDEAIEIFHEVIALDPKNSMAFGNISNLMLMKRDLNQALDYAEKTFKLTPTVAGSYLYTMCFHCEWENYDTVLSKLNEDSKFGWSGPFAPIIFSNEPKHHLAYSKNWANQVKSTNLLGPLKPHINHKKIKIAYFTSDFFAHATAMLIEGLLLSHDRELFELHAFSLDLTKEDEYTHRIKNLFDHYHEVFHYSDRAIANLSRELEIDIAIDLKGYTEGSRPAIFAEKAAPVQINFLGFPGSMGADFIDYMIADPYTITDENRAFFSENIIYMPDCYQPNHPGRPKPNGESSRPAELPSDKFVFCSFNNAYKITPGQFQLWMRILHEAPDSVLWLLKSTEKAHKNLHRYTREAGIDPSRVIFAPFLPEAAHLERLTHADLFLDSFPCNAHTTASDALWAGIPLLTRSGNTFASRVAGSILTSMGADELIVTHEEDYFQLAMRIYKDKEYLRHLKKMVKSGISNGPLYDIKKYTKNFENALMQAQSQCQNADSKTDIFVKNTI